MSLRANSIELLKSLIDHYEQQENITPSEFLEVQLEKQELDDETIRVFLNICKYLNFLNLITQDFYSSLSKCKGVGKLSSNFSEYAYLLLYIIIFELSEDNLEEIMDIIKVQIKFLKTTQNVVHYIQVESNFINVVQAGTTLYGNDHVLQIIINPYLQKLQTIQTLHLRVKNEIASFKTKNKKSPTIPITTKLATPSKLSIQMKANILPTKFKANKIPPTTYISLSNEKLNENYNKNRDRALKLYKFAQNNSFGCAVVKPEKPRSPPKPPTIQPPKPFPKFQKVEVKSTTATLMRQTALLAREKEDEIRQIEKLISGDYDANQFELLETEIRSIERQKQLQEIERKHLQGLLTREDAIIAKQKLLEQNKQKMSQYQEHRVMLLEEIDKIRLAQQEKNKETAAKVQQIEKAAREAEVRMQEEKRCNAKLLEDETKRLLQEAATKQEAEFVRKLQLIEEIRTLHQVSVIGHMKEFDRTETSNLGLLCEMSIAELQERLNLLRINMMEELFERRKKISEDKRRQQKMLDDMKVFVEEAQRCKPKRLGKAELVLQETPDIIELRQRLAQAREMRMKSV